MRRKGQEELVGFVLIMVILAVVVLIFLGITVRKGGTTSFDSVEAQQFTQSVMEVTTDCELRFSGDYARMSEVLRACADGRNCYDGTPSCEAAEMTLEGILEASWNVGVDTPITQYEWSSVYALSDDEEELIVTLVAGNCTGSVRGATVTNPAAPGRIITTFTLCGS